MKQTPCPEPPEGLDVGRRLRAAEHSPLKALAGKRGRRASGTTTSRSKLVSCRSACKPWAPKAHRITNTYDTKVTRGRPRGRVAGRESHPTCRREPCTGGGHVSARGGAPPRAAAAHRSTSADGPRTNRRPSNRAPPGTAALGKSSVLSLGLRLLLLLAVLLGVPRGLEALGGAPGAPLVVALCLLDLVLERTHRGLEVGHGLPQGLDGP